MAIASPGPTPCQNIRMSAKQEVRVEGGTSVGVAEQGQQQCLGNQEATTVEMLPRALLLAAQRQAAAVTSRAASSGAAAASGASTAAARGLDLQHAGGRKGATAPRQEGGSLRTKPSTDLKDAPMGQQQGGPQDKEKDAGKRAGGGARGGKQQQSKAPAVLPQAPQGLALQGLALSEAPGAQAGLATDMRDSGSKGGKEGGEGDVAEGGQPSKPPPPPPPPRPNYFFALRVSHAPSVTTSISQVCGWEWACRWDWVPGACGMRDPAKGCRRCWATHAAVPPFTHMQVQASLVSHTPGLAPACEAPVKAHLTLLVMHLPHAASVSGGTVVIKKRKEGRHCSVRVCIKGGYWRRSMRLGKDRV